MDLVSLKAGKDISVYDIISCFMQSYFHIWLVLKQISFLNLSFACIFLFILIKNIWLWVSFLVFSSRSFSPIYSITYMSYISYITFIFLFRWCFSYSRSSSQLSMLLSSSTAAKESGWWWWSWQWTWFWSSIWLSSVFYIMPRRICCCWIRKCLFCDYKSFSYLWIPKLLLIPFLSSY